MSEFKVGDRVRVVTKDEFNTKVGVIDFIGDGIHVRLDDESESGPFFFNEDEVVLESEHYVNVIESRAIWVTLPGDNAGHKLTEDEARALFVQLEEIL